jgi:hypothetical protein
VNKNQRNTLILVLVTLALALIVSIYQGLSWVTYLDTLFLISLIILIIGLGMFVIIGGFLDTITYTFRRAFRSFSKRAEFLKDDLETMSLPSEVLSSQIMKACLISGLILTALSIIIGFFV